MDFLTDNRTRVFCSRCRAEYLETYGACPACGEASLSALNRVEPQVENPNASCAQCACCGTKYLASGHSCPECGSIATEGMDRITRAMEHKNFLYFNSIGIGVRVK